KVFRTPIVEWRRSFRTLAPRAPSVVPITVASRRRRTSAASSRAPTIVVSAYPPTTTEPKIRSASAAITVALLRVQVLEHRRVDLVAGGLQLLGEVRP